jgi:protease II
MVTDTTIRHEVHGRTIADAYDWLLDENIRRSDVMGEAAKNLEKVIFAHPLLVRQIRPIIRSLKEEK